MLHDNLLGDARSLLRNAAGRPRQSNIRRAISTAYYALFHLLVYEACQRTARGKDLRLLIARSFEHSRMRDASKAFGAGNLPSNVLQALGAQPSKPLQQIAVLFLSVLEARHDADYNVGKRFTKSDGLKFVAQTEMAFKTWQDIRATKEAEVYLMSLLLWKTWNH